MGKKIFQDLMDENFPKLKAINLQIQEAQQTLNRNQPCSSW